jgi:hypothetical protein
LELEPHTGWVVVLVKKAAGAGVTLYGTKCKITVLINQRHLERLLRPIFFIMLNDTKGIKVIAEIKWWINDDSDPSKGSSKIWHHTG